MTYECMRANCTEPRTDYSQLCDSHRCRVVCVGVKDRGRRCMATTNRPDGRCETHALRETDLLIPMEAVL